MEKSKITNSVNLHLVIITCDTVSSISTQDSTLLMYLHLLISINECYWNSVVPENLFQVLDHGDDAAPGQTVVLLEAQEIMGHVTRTPMLDSEPMTARLDLSTRWGRRGRLLSI